VDVFVGEFIVLDAANTLGGTGAFRGTIGGGIGILGSTIPAVLFALLENGNFNSFSINCELFSCALPNLERHS
jgi:hypothetical protein